MDANLPSGDAVEIAGLSVLLDEEEIPPFLQIELRCARTVYRGAILAVEGEWAFHLRDEDGVGVVTEGDLYPTQSSAILAAMLTALDAGRAR